MEGFDYTTLMNYGAMGVVLVYFMWERSATMKKLTETLQELKEAVQMLRAKVGD